MTAFLQPAVAHRPALGIIVLRPAGRRLRLVEHGCPTCRNQGSHSERWLLALATVTPAKWASAFAVGARPLWGAVWIRVRAGSFRSAPPWRACPCVAHD